MRTEVEDMFAKLKRRYKNRKKKGGIRKHRFIMCTRRCGGDRSCMSACLKRHA